MMPCRRAIRCAMRIDAHVVRAEEHGEHDAHGGDDERGEERPAEVVDPEHPVGHVVGGDQEDEGVRDQHEQEAEDERERQPQRGEHRRDDRVQRRDDHRDESAPQKLSMSTPGRIPAATITATPVASHETRSGNSRQRGRSGCQAVDGRTSARVRWASGSPPRWADRRPSSASSSGSRSRLPCSEDVARRLLHRLLGVLLRILVRPHDELLAALHLDSRMQTAPRDNGPFPRGGLEQGIRWLASRAIATRSSVTGRRTLAGSRSTRSRREAKAH